MTNQACPPTARAHPGVASLAPYEPGKPMSELSREYGLTDIVKLASNESPFGPAPGAREVLAEGLAGLNRYPDGGGFELKRALADRHGVGTDAITLGNGSNDVLDLLARVFLGPGRNAVVSRHAFAIYALITRALGAECRVAEPFPEDHDRPFGHDLAAMAERVDGDTGIVFIANPNNPTGTWATQAELAALLERVPEETVVVLDEAYADFLDSDEYPHGPDWLAAHPNLVVTRTFSKAHGLAGVRVGYALSHPAIGDLLNRVRQPFNVNELAQVAARASLDEPQHVRSVVAHVEHEKRRVESALQEQGVRHLPSAANFLCVEVGDAQQMHEALLRAGVIVRPLAGYELPGWLRVSVGTETENDRFLAALAGARSG